MPQYEVVTQWDQQPQEITEINWENPISADLAFAANAGTGIDLVSGAIPVLSGSSTKIVGEAGIAFSSPSTQIPGAWTYTVSIPSSFDCTVLVVECGRVAQGASAAVPTLHFNSAEPVMFSTTGSESIFSTTNNSSTTITGLSAGTVYSLSGVKRINSQEQYVNGALRTTNVTGNRAIGNITTVSIGRPSGGNNLQSQEYYLVLYWRRALHPAEIASVSANPWQLFSRKDWVTVAAAGGGGVNLLPSSIGSSEAFGSHTIVRGGVQILTTGITSAQAFGSHVIGIAGGPQFISPTGIVSAMAFGTPQMGLGASGIVVPGVGSLEAFGTPTIVRGLITIIPSGIVSSQAFGTPGILKGTLVIYPGGIPSIESFGIPAIVGGTPVETQAVFYVRGFSAFGSRRNS